MIFKTLKHKQLEGVFGCLQDNNPGGILLLTSIPQLQDKGITKAEILKNLKMLEAIYKTGDDYEALLDSLELVEVKLMI